LNHDAPGGKCMYSNKLQKFFETKRAFSTNLDIEDLVAFGKKRRLCPYFLAREASQYSEIIMCPYNYLIEPSMARSFAFLFNLFLFSDSSGYGNRFGGCDCYN
jgi:hypothetical protein